MSLLKKENSMPVLNLAKDQTISYKKLGGGFALNSRLKNTSLSPVHNISRNQGTIVRHTHSHA